ncbi:hypothetical protein C7M61_002296 [Candidozyma pseudohaemuli]|uniref:Uncharacterized protein n=1 Tax=Candidozyma pseudohaemuli TaxID=418784 RepID=A0A2P7YSS2_9ASCO|nr:hypothetical protein C7M61_002296 [[Candida] pseudohaemulonii]PSK38989.1 hypothetical protein C7M61_002296 [[Candida] pseudohaemulonii]
MTEAKPAETRPEATQPVENHDVNLTAILSLSTVASLVRLFQPFMSELQSSQNTFRLVSFAWWTLLFCCAGYLLGKSNGTVSVCKAGSFLVALASIYESLEAPYAHLVSPVLIQMGTSLSFATSFHSFLLFKPRRFGELYAAGLIVAGLLLSFGAARYADEPWVISLLGTCFAICAIAVPKVVPNAGQEVTVSKKED